MIVAGMHGVLLFAIESILFLMLPYNALPVSLVVPFLRSEKTPLINDKRDLNVPFFVAYSAIK